MDRAGTATDEHRLVVDTERSSPGRGAWLHPERRCLETAERRRAIPRALRVTGPLDLAGVRAYLAETSTDR
ncbi:YlxR family protein [Oerskovia flava]|uniref:YlxR family protein n=1 Tax=Oerskovia flava TaxID=2986422 RepID=UPI003CCE23F4